MPFTASLFQQGGLIIPILLFVFFAVLSTLACLFIVEAMRLIPGNKNFQGVVEFATLVNFYFSDRPFIHLFAQLCLYGAIQSNAIQSIVLSAQTLDNVLIDIFGKTCGLAVPPFHSIWHCVSETSSTSSPFGDTVMFFTIGYLLVLVFVIPMAIFDLEE